MWTKLDILGSHPLYIDAFCKSREDDLDTLTELHKLIELFRQMTSSFFISTSLTKSA